MLFLLEIFKTVTCIREIKKPISSRYIPSIFHDCFKTPSPPFPQQNQLLTALLWSDVSPRLASPRLVSAAPILVNEMETSSPPRGNEKGRDNIPGKVTGMAASLLAVLCASCPITTTKHHTSARHATPRHGSITLLQAQHERHIASSA